MNYHKVDIFTVQTKYNKRLQHIELNTLTYISEE